MNDLKSVFQITSNTHNRFEADHVYVDCNAINNDTINCIPVPLVYNQTKSSNIINDCSEYHCSVVRFQIDSILPVIIPLMELELTPESYYQARTMYYFNIGYGTDPDSAILVNGATGSAEGECVRFYPDNFNKGLYPNYQLPSALPKTQIEVNNNPYFWLSSIKSFLTLLNRALYVIYFRAKGLYLTQLAKASPPEFIWNTATQKIDLIVSEEFLSPNIVDSTKSNFFITINAPLYNLLNTFSFTVNGVYSVNQWRDGVPFFFNLYKNYGINTITVPINVPPTPADGTLLYRFESEASSVPSWTPCSSIVFSSYTIPVNSSEAGVVEYLGSKSPFNTNSANNLVNELTDFIVNQDIGTELSNSVLYYTPASEYRLISLNSNQPINKINIKVSWLDKFGGNHDFLLNYGGSASLKLLLRRKNYNNMNYD
jgi:hypothetical protein